MADRERRNLIFAHQEWLGFVQPVGLVVAPTVMVDAQVVPDRNVSGRQREFQALMPPSRPMRPRSSNVSGRRRKSRAPVDANDGASSAAGVAEARAAYRVSGTPQGSVPHRVFREWLGWEDGDLVDAARHRDELEIALPELQVVLSATWAVPGDRPALHRAAHSPDPCAARRGDRDTGPKWTMLVRVEDAGADLDRPPDDGAGWSASRHARFERLLRETGVPTGLLCTDERIRLIHAPRGESSGHITFDFGQMALPAGRPILAAFDMLLGTGALFGGDPEARLPALLARSREAQAEVSTRLSRQVLAALHELLRGFGAADARGAGTVAELTRRDPEHLYGGLITTLMRLVFVLYAEDRGLMPEHSVYQQHYSLGGLFARLRSDAAAWPDTMDQRFGAWAQLLALFRLIHGGGRHRDLAFVARRGSLFDPDRFPFLEGRGPDGEPTIPMVPDATVWNVLRSLMVLDGERLSYRTLDVEQIGSVYEAVMGFRIERTTGRSIAVASPKRTGAAVVVDLDRLLALEGGKRVKSLQDRTDRKLTGNAAAALRGAATVEDIVAALGRAVDRDATPDIVPLGVPVLQPTDERRRSGSHYTPRSLTEPIVSEALRPAFERLGRNARPGDVLDLKVLDPATGSGAFLVEACRQLSARLVKAWNRHGGPPALPADEDELLHARRLVAQRCLYGVDRNPMAIDLARLSLWLVTLARDHEFTFIDHALRHGDSLVGLTRRQIEGFHWDAEAPRFQFGFEAPEVQAIVARVSELRRKIRELGDEAPEHELRELLDEADRELGNVRGVADLLLAAFFEGGKPKDRERRRLDYASRLLDAGRAATATPTAPKPPVVAFHWELEFPEVFERENPGFDVVVGNPPFLGGKRISTIHGTDFRDWLVTLHSQSNSNADVVAHFFRRAFGLLRDGGTLGLIATNTIGQGDTRSTGLRWICKHGGNIYRASRRLKWPGEAAVVVSVIHIAKGGSEYSGRRILDGQDVGTISAFLFHDGDHDDPERLEANSGKSFQGSIVLGMGFTFDNPDRKRKGVAMPLAERQRLIDENPRNRDAIFPYIGGEEVNTSPIHKHHRFVINFHDWPLRRADLGATWRDADAGRRQDWRRDGIVPLDYPGSVAADWPELLDIVEKRVKPERDVQNRKALRERWWHYADKRPGLYAAIYDLDRVLVINCGATSHLAFCFLPSEMVFANTLAVLSVGRNAAFCALQARPHEIWARFFGSSLGDGLRYTPSDCFETFPLPENWETLPALEAAGKTYYDFRAKLMKENNEGMTKTYNRFHDRDERDPRIARLRELHAVMDRAVLDAYGWGDIQTDCEFLLDYEIDEATWGSKKKPYRYRWPDEVHDEVLARLLALNAERAAEERLAGRDARFRAGNAKAAS